MKISKLFHWLYAFLMFLPVFFIGSRCFYVILNKNAKDSYYGETINEVIYTDFTGDFNLNDLYVFSNTGSVEINTTISPNPRITITDFTFNGNYSINSNPDYAIDECNTMIIWRSSSTNSLCFDFYKDNSNNGYYYINTSLVNANFQFRYLSLYGNNDTYIDLLKDNLQILTYNEYSYLDNAFEYSINSLNEVQLFSWAQTSFLSAPMVYITGLFGMSNNSPVITLLSYWLSISIVWLVFDLVMYIPLLVHRWIDRGIIE